MIVCRNDGRQCLGLSLVLKCLLKNDLVLQGHHNRKKGTIRENENYISVTVVGNYSNALYGSLFDHILRICIIEITFFSF